MNDFQNFETILDEFVEWIVGVEEDDPLPLEIKNMYLIIEKFGDTYALSYWGAEQYQKKAINFDYYPLDAQFFHSETFFEFVKDKDIKNITELLLQNALKITEFYNNFIGRTIYIAFCHEKPFFKVFIK